MYEGDGYIHTAPTCAESVVAAPAGSLLARLADWFFSRISADRSREVESYLSGALNERDLAQRLHRIEGGSALFAA
jgi:NhaP-type Na+/H+ or K+/H+ antiporter